MTTATRLSGPQKAAALVLALGDDQAAALLGRLHDDEVRDLSAAMASLGPVPAPRLEELCREFAEALGRAGGLAGGAERLLLKPLSCTWFLSTAICPRGDRNDEVQHERNRSS